MSDVLQVGYCCHDLQKRYVYNALERVVVRGSVVRRWAEMGVEDYSNRLLHVRRMQLDVYEIGELEKEMLLGMVNLLELKICYDLNQILDVGMLPYNLKQLHFGDGFNQPLNEGVLPSTLQQLHFGDRFNHPLNEGVLASTLEYLHLGFCFNQPPSACILPMNLKSLRDRNHIVADVDIPAGCQR